MATASDDEEGIDSSVNSLLLPNQYGKKKALPARYVFVIFSFLGFNMLYALRVNLSVAIVSMVSASNSSRAVVKTECISPNSALSLNSTSEYASTDGFHWDQTVQSQILGSFFIGYVIPQVPAGQLAEKYGSKRLLGCSIFFSSILTLLSPMAAKLHYTLFIGCRILMGVFEGLFFPSMHAMVAKWLPKSERSFLTSIIYSGAQIGTVITMSSTGFLTSSEFMGGWPSAFYTFGLLGLIWFFLWMNIIYETPQEHPSISDEELLYIVSGQASAQTNKNSITPWRLILTSSAVWAIIFAHFGNNWGFYTLLFELPTFLKTVLGLNIKENGLISGLPYLLQAGVGWFSGYFIDRLISSGKMTPTSVRKLSNTIGFLGPALCLVGLTLAKCSYFWNIAMLLLAMALNGFIYSGFNVSHVDIAPDYAGTLMGITNTIGNFAGILAPAYVGFLTQDEVSLQRWSYVFYTSSVIYSVTAVIFAIFGTAELQKWGLAKSNKTPSLT